MTEVSNGTPWRWASLLLALLVLNASLTFHNWWPTPAVRWNGELSAEAAAAVLMLVIAFRRSRRPAPRALRWLASLWIVLVVSRYADVTTPALYGRDVNLYWDVRYVPAVGAMLVRVASWRLVLLVAGVAVLVPMLLYAIVRPAFGRVAKGLERDDERRVLAFASAAVVLLFAAQQLAARLPRVPGFSRPVVSTYARQVELAAAAMTAARTRNIGPPRAIEADLARVQGADVFLIFIESYGAVSFDRPQFASGLTASRARFAQDIRSTGRDAVSTFVESPTFGGNSWLAHVSLLSGVEVRDQGTNVELMAQKRDTMVTAFNRQGYRTLAVMPGLHESWPEGQFYGFNEIYDETRLNYLGPPFGWWTVPDQFVIAKLDALAEAAKPRVPVFAFFPTTNTHTPFSPTPPYQPDWPRVLTDAPFPDAELARVWQQVPDWLDLGPDYVRAVAYTYETLGGYLRLRRDKDFVMILLGDHQPPAVVSGEGASWEVPVHVITSRRAILDALVARGFTPGLSPRHPATSKMHALLPVLLSALSGSPTTPRTP
jgi:Sulfatase